MSVTAIVGVQRGNEGKGLITTFLSEDAEIIIRCQGGDKEAGCVVNEYGKFLLHMAPCGIFNPDAMNIIAPGVLLNLDALNSEFAEIEVKTGQSPENLFIDKRTNIVMPYQLAKGDESVKACLLDKVAGLGITAGDLLDDDVLKTRLTEVTNAKGINNFEELLMVCHYYKDRFAPYIIDTLPIVRYAVENDSPILLQGNGGLLSDINWGIDQMYGNSSAALCQGAGIAPKAITKTIGVAKAENNFDAIALDYACYIDGVTDVALTSLSSLDSEEELKICTGYMIEGEYYQNLPEAALARRAKPIYETFPGWLCPTLRCSSWEELPKNAQDYIKAIEEYANVHIAFIAVGQDQVIIR